MRSRIASEREPTLFCLAHSSTALIIAGGSLSATSGSLPVAGLPALFFTGDLGITFIDFFDMRGLYLNYEPMKRLDPERR